MQLVESGLRSLLLPALGLLSAVVAGSWGPAPTLAAEPVVIAVIDMQKIRREASAVQSLQRQIDRRRSAYQGQLQKEEEELRKTDQELARQRAVLSADAFAQKRRELEQQVAALQREIQERRKGLEELFSDGMSQVQRYLAEVVGQIAREREVDLVLTKAAVALVKPELEITAEALERLNSALPDVRLSDTPQ